MQVPAGSNVARCSYQTAGINLGELDRSDPPLFTVLSDGSQVSLVRVREEYYIEQVVIPFEHQELRNEALTTWRTVVEPAGCKWFTGNHLPPRV